MAKTKLAAGLYAGGDLARSCSAVRTISLTRFFVLDHAGGAGLQMSPAAVSSLYQNVLAALSAQRT